jgi:hypothetical protein
LNPTTAVLSIENFLGPLIEYVAMPCRHREREGGLISLSKPWVFAITSKFLADKLVLPINDYMQEEVETFPFEMLGHVFVTTEPEKYRFSNFCVGSFAVLHQEIKSLQVGMIHAA